MADYSTIAFIGGGNMATSLIGGLVATGYPTNQLHVYDPDTEKLEHLASKYGITQTHSELNHVIAEADCIALAVKPQILQTVSKTLSTQLEQARPLLISVVAGIQISSILRWLDADFPIVRCMPNTPALVQHGATAMYANQHVSNAQRNLSESILQAVGITIWVNSETILDTVTAISGSGPAYFFLIFEILEQIGTQLGLQPEQSRLLTLQTALGASAMAMQSEESPSTLRQRVTSKGGTTERAIDILQTEGIFDLLSNAVQAAKQRSQELAQELDKP